MTRFSVARMGAVFIKEFQQMLRDRLTFAMAIGVPVMQLVLFGDAINTDPKDPPTTLVTPDTGPLARSVVAALQNTGYFKLAHRSDSEAAGQARLQAGEVPFMLVIPPDISQRVVRGERPALLVAVDTTDPRPRATPSPRWPLWPTRRWRLS